VIAAVRSSNEAVKISALRTLATLGDGSAVEAVAEAALGGAAVREAAREALGHMPGVGVNQRIVALLEGGAPAIQIELVRAAGTRKIADALPAIRKAASGGSAELRAEAVRSLGDLGIAEDLPPLLATLKSSPSEELTDAIVAVASRTREAGTVADAAQGDPGIPCVFRLDCPHRGRAGAGAMADDIAAGPVVADRGDR